MRFDTLSETVIGMMAEANKLQHLGVDVGENQCQTM